MRKVSFIIFLAVATLSSCRHDHINLSEKEYKENKNQGFWVLKTKKILRHNQLIAKPKRHRQMKRLARENKQIEKYNAKQRKRMAENKTTIKSFGNGAHYKTFEHH